VKRVVEEQMRLDDETTASQLHVILTRMGYTMSLRTILRCRTSLGWTFRGSAYYQLIRDVNKQKRLEFALEHRSDNFANVIQMSAPFSWSLIVGVVARKERGLGTNPGKACAWHYNC